MPETPPNTSFQVIIVSPNETIFEGQAVRFFAPGANQEIAILPDHTPLYSALHKGQIKVHGPNSQLNTFDIDSGILRVKSNQVTAIIGL